MPVGAIIGAGALGAGASLIGSGQQSSAAKSAAATQAASADKASALQQQMFEQSRNDLSPYMALGPDVIQQLLAKANAPGVAPPDLNVPLGDWQASPGYQFIQNETQKQVANSAAARGLGQSGPALQAAAQYGEGVASTEESRIYDQLAQQQGFTQNTRQQDYLNKLTSTQQGSDLLLKLLGVGENAAAGVGNAGIETGNNIANNIIGAGNANAAGQVASANANAGGLTSAAGSAGNAFSSYLLYNKLFPSDTVSGTATNGALAGPSYQYLIQP